MPKERQMTLLRQLVGDKVSNHLYKVIVELTEEQQTFLLEQMSRSTKMDLPNMTVSQGETDTSMRENVRKPCLINVSYQIQDQIYKSYLLNISIGGVFVEADTQFPVGRQLLLKFSLPNRQQPITFAGQIVWRTTRGFGVKFEKVNDLKTEILKSFVEQKE
jgi:Tfp pilus assembly protein PilZ